MALLEQFTNFASTVTVNALNAGDTAIVITDPSRFPSLGASQYFYAVLSDSINPLVPPTKREIVKITARSGANLTAVRGQDGTSAQTWAAGSYFELRLVAQALTDLHDQTIVDAQATQYALSSPTDITLTYDNDNNGSGSFLVKKAASTKLQVTNAGELIANPSYANMKQWGADNTGVSDCLAAVQAALAAGYTKLYFPKGRYNFSSGTGIVTTGQNLMIYGDGTNNTVLFISGAAGFDLINFTGDYTEFYSHCLVVKDIGLETTVASGAAQGSAIKATMNASASVNKAPYTSVYLDNVAAGNGVYNSCWAYGVRMDTCQFAKILNCFFDGFMPTAPGAGTRAGVGIDLYSRLTLNNNVKATDINIENTTVFQAVTGIQINNYPDSNYNYCEGVHIDHSTVLNCTTGIRIGTTAFLSASLLPGFYINGTHITATAIGVDVQTVSQFFMAESLIYATGGTNFTGVNFVVDATAGGYAQSMIRNSAIIVPPAYAGNIYGVNVTAADATPANANLSISGNLFSSLTAFTACVNAAANVQGVLVEPNNRYVAQPFVSVTDSGSNNIMKGFNDYVGIMKSPTFPLDVKSPSGVAAGLRLENGDTSTNNIGIRFRGGNAAADQWVIGNAVGSNDASRNFDFYDLIAAANRLRIASDGNVGIGTGTTAPGFRLDVKGAAGNGVPAQRWEPDGGSGIFVELERDAGGTGSAVFGTQTNHNLVLKANDSNKVWVLPDGNMGVGVSPASAYRVHVYHGTADAVVRVESGSGYAGQSYHASGTNPCYIFFSNVTNGERVRLYASNAGEMYFYSGVGITEVARLYTDGLRLPNTKAVLFKDSTGTDQIVLQYWSDDGVYLGNPKSGKNMYFQTTTSGAWIFRNSTIPSDRLTITASGQIYANAIHNNAGGASGATAEYIASGTYTPGLNNVTNVAASTAYLCQWIRVGRVVTVSGLVNIDPTSAGVATELGIALPIASNFTATSNLAGTANANGTERACFIQADTVNDRAQVLWTPTGTADTAFSFTFQYTVL